jgi:DNA polymerase III delta prime subunit
MQTLYDLLQDCTVKIPTSGQGWGTGFFVAPGQLLTCAHVVQAQATQPISLERGGQLWGTAQVETLLPAPFDLALLHLETAQTDDYPCVRLEAGAAPQQPLYLYGYSDTMPEGESVQGDCEGTATQQGVEFIKFKLARVRPGISGSPVLNLKTGGVCGLVRQTLDRSELVGGLALPTAQILTCFPQLAAANQAFHGTDARWRQAHAHTDFGALAQRATQIHTPSGGLRPHGEVMLLQRVQMDHVDQPLQSALFNLDPITLTKVETPDQVRPLGQKYVLVGDEQAVSSIAPIGQDWDDCGGKLLILGQPGAGKTTTLLVLAQALVDRAWADATAGIPVIVNLASWQPGQSIATWLLKELKDDYGLQPQQGRAYLQQRKLIPLLDGLDEQLDLADCAAAINQFLADPTYGPHQLVVCCRQAEYGLLLPETGAVLGGSALNSGALSAGSLLRSPDQIAATTQRQPSATDHRLQLNGAIALKPLTRSQITAYLKRFPASEGLATLTDSDALMVLVQTPLLLSVTAIAFRHLSLDHLKQLATPQEQEQYLWQSYLQRMLTYGATQNQAGDRPRRRQFPPPAQTLQWLRAIAANLTRTAQTELLIENLQPQWYPEGLDRRIQHVLKGLAIAALALFLIGGGGVFVAFMGMMLSNMAPPAWVAPFMALCGLAIGVFLLHLGLKDLFYGQIKTVEALGWSWPAFRQGMAHLPKTSRRVLVGLVVGPIRRIPKAWTATGSIPYISGWAVMALLALPLFTLFGLYLLGLAWVQLLLSGDWAAIAIACLAVGLLWLTLALPTGIELKPLEDKVLPNQGIRRSQRSFLLGFLLNGLRLLVVVIEVGIAAGFLIRGASLGGGATLEILVVLTLSLASLAFFVWIGFSAISGFWRYGGSACIRHLWLRIWLTRAGVLPWNCARFLNRATELRLMQRVGGRYRFIHRSFQEYLAQLTPGSPLPPPE